MRKVLLGASAAWVLSTTLALAQPFGDAPVLYGPPPAKNNTLPLQPGAEGTFTCTDATFNAYGIATAASSGTCGSGSGNQVDFIASAFTNSGNNYSITAAGFTLQNGYRVRGIPGETSTATPYLNVQGTGSLPIYRQNTGGFVTAGPGDVVTSVIQDFTYNSVLGGWVVTSLLPSLYSSVAVDTTVSAAAFANGACLYRVTAAKTITFPASSALASGGACYVWAYGANVTLASSGGDTINITSVLNGQIALVTSNGSNALQVQLSGTPVGTSGGVPYYSSTTNTASSGALTANMPVLGGGAGAAPTVGTVSGNTTKFGTVSGSLTSGNCIKSDASGNLVDAATTCGGSGSGGGPVPSYIANNWYLPEYGTLAAGSATTAGRIYARPFYVSKAITISNLGARISTNGSSNSQFAIYASNANGTRPTGNALCSTSDIANNGGTGNISGACSSGSLSAGTIVWLEVNSNDSSVAFQTLASSNSNMGWLIGSSTQGGIQVTATTSISTLQATQSYGTWPDETSTSWTELTGNTVWPLISFKVGSVP